MIKKFDIITFGSCLTDIFTYTDIKEQGHSMVYPVGSKLQIKNIKFDIGGGGLNTATTFSKMGLNTAYWGSLNPDAFGKKILKNIKNNNITFLGSKKGENGYSIILDSKEHERTILTYKGSNDFLKLTEKQIKELDTKWIYFSSLIGESFQTYLKIAKFHKDKKIAFNPSMYLLKKENARDLIKYCFTIILNKEEADMLERNHKNLLNLGPKIICITDGKHPFYCYTKDKTYKISPNDDVKVVERTGAGDAFASGFVASLIKTNDIEKSLKIGVANSESVVQYFGAQNKILTWREALVEISKHACKVDIVG